MNRWRIGFSVCIAVFLTGVSSSADADLLDFDLLWTGDGVTVTGSITIDSDLVPNPGFYIGPFADQPGVRGIGASPFSNFSMTVEGAGIFDGTYTGVGGDFSEVLWSVDDGGPLFGLPSVDLSQELVGQEFFDDFNVFAAPESNAPTGFDEFTMIVGEEIKPQGGAGGGFIVTLQSFAPAGVPEPGSLICLITIGAGLILRRHR